MRRLPLFLAATSVLLAACAAPEGSLSGSGTAGPSSSATPALATRSLQPMASGVTETVTGTLGFDTIEGGCGYLETAGGARYQVLYPDGWRLDRSTGALTGPGGAVVQVGGTVRVRGSIATDMASTCQVGPVFRAVDVALVAP